MKWHLSRRSAALAVVCALLVALLAVGVALAVSLTMSNADGVWSNPTGSSGSPTCVNYSNQGSSTTDENQIRYGEIGFFSTCPGSLSTDQSGFGFDGTNGPLNFETGQVFLLGKFTHFNQPIVADSTMTSVKLAVTLNFSTPPGLNPLLNYTVTLDETPNDGSCPYGDSTGNGCDDRVTVPASTPDQTFTIDGTDYTLQVIGFVPLATDTACPSTPSGSISTIYTTGEEKSNYACLYAQIVLPIDSGDAPDTPAGQTLGANRASHVIVGGAPYFGTVRGDGENNGQPNAAATGDDNAAFDDEDGFAAYDEKWVDGAGWIDVTVNRGTAGDRACVYSWIDWGADGFGVGSDSTAAAEVTSSGTVRLNYNSNIPNPLPQNAYLRLRVTSNTGACPALGAAGGLPTGQWANGEVEDHKMPSPTAVDISSFAGASDNAQVVLTWETVSEADRYGFNLYRSDSASGPWIKLNSTMIPAVTPGSTEGHLYNYTDANVQTGNTYFYVLESISLGGQGTRLDPISVKVEDPTAVGLRGLSASSATGALAWVALMAGLAALGLVSFKRR